MAKRVMQFRYYDTGNIKNAPSKIQANTLISGKIFNNYFPIYHLGIQTLPGVQFYLNHGTDPIMIGSTGIYELNLEGLSEITSLKFTKASVDMIETTPGAYLIVDLVYEDLEA